LVALPLRGFPYQAFFLSATKALTNRNLTNRKLRLIQNLPIINVF
jgi:hypothetical protein